MSKVDERIIAEQARELDRLRAEVAAELGSPRNPADPVPSHVRAEFARMHDTVDGLRQMLALVERERDEARAELRRLLTPIVIEVCERLHDWTPDGGPKYHAQIHGEPGRWVCSATVAGAIGELIRTHPERFGVAVHWLPGRLAR